MSACLTIESDLAHLSTIQTVLTQLIESGVPLVISGLRLLKRKAGTALPKPSNPPKQYARSSGATIDLTKESQSDEFKVPALKRKTCHLDDDEEDFADDESDLDPDTDDDDSDLEVLDDEELHPLLGGPSAAGPSELMEVDGNVVPQSFPVPSVMSSPSPFN